ncbi:MAG: hypothetical protein JRG91_20300, partial [Deltaproteobacteria bacterium]|nr:hypothetical protein [Deltaproteobacteria bacterium]
VPLTCGDGDLDDGEECDDGNETAGDGCESSCRFSCHEDPECDDENVCTDEACVEGGTGRICEYENNTAPCDDDNVCTDPDVCSDGVCAPGPGVCECETTADCAEHEDGNLCNGTFICDTTSNLCEVDPTTVVTCSPTSTLCHVLVCVPETGLCVDDNPAEGTACEDDSHPCTDDECDGSGSCLHNAIDCDDGDVCTTDSCDTTSGCVTSFNTAACDDGDICTTPDACDGTGTCVGTDTGTTNCSGVCVDTDTDRNNCGSCGTICGSDEDCISGTCTTPTWTPVGGAVTSGTVPSVAHAIGNSGSQVYVALVEEFPGYEHDVIVRRFSSGSWANVGSSFVPTDRDAASVVDIAFHGTTPYVIYHEGFGTAHVEYFSSGSWTEVGAPGFGTLCGSLVSLDLALDSVPHPHFTYMGAGGCGIGVGYVWHDGTIWRHRPSTAWSGTELITMNGSGWPDIAYTDRAYIALADSSVHSVTFWDTFALSWGAYGSILDINSDVGWDEASYITSDSSGVLYVAWSEEDSTGGRARIYVKRWASTDWALVGTGAVSTGGDARNPAIVIASGTPYVTWQELTAGVSTVYVKRLSGTSWTDVGGALNNVSTRDAVEPDITAIGSTVYVAFREDDGAGLERIYVKSL